MFTKQKTPKCLYRADRSGIEIYMILGKSGKFYITDKLDGRRAKTIEKEDVDNANDGRWGYYTTKQKAIEAAIREQDRRIEESVQIIKDLRNL